jgi:hypothetical protein
MLAGIALLLGCALYAFAQLTPVLPGPGPGGPDCTPNTQGGGSGANVVALYHFDNNGNDSSGHGNNLTRVNGSPSYSNTTFKWGYANLNGGSGGWRATALNVGFVIAAANGDFTIEFWFNATASGIQVFVSDDNIATFDETWGVHTTSRFDTNIGPGTVRNISTITALPTGAWHSLAWVRASNVVTGYYDGVAQTMAGTSGTGALGNTAKSFLVGGNYGSNLYSYSGYMDELRISNVARYTANYTPATRPFCNG